MSQTAIDDAADHGRDGGMLDKVIVHLAKCDRSRRCATRPPRPIRPIRLIRPIGPIRRGGRRGAIAQALPRQFCGPT